jgi:hypothetical protein
MNTSHPAKTTIASAIIVISGWAGPNPTHAAEQPAVVSTESQPWSVSLRWENDTFGGTDHFYTDGASIALVHTGSSGLDAVADRLPWGQGRRTVGYDFGQIMTTPSDTTRAVPDPTDRPYAGILYFGVSLHVDRDNSYHGLRFITGVVGPWSQAERTQKQVHRTVGVPLPQGWDHQLHNEPIFNFVYEHRRKYRLWGANRGLAVEALPSANIMLGNVLTQGQVGGQLRVGYNIPDDFGTTLMRGMGHLPPPRPAPRGEASPAWGGYVYGGFHASLVLRNLTLDGNTWRDSPGVDRDLFVPAAEVGFAVTTRSYLVAFSYVFWGREFKGQPSNSRFGAFTLTRMF